MVLIWCSPRLLYRCYVVLQVYSLGHSCLWDQLRREGEREGGREGGKEGGREGGKEGGREGRKKGGRERGDGVRDRLQNHVNLDSCKLHLQMQSKPSSMCMCVC